MNSEHTNCQSIPSVSDNITVKRLVESRYPLCEKGDQKTLIIRPTDWDKRVAGVDLIETECGKSVRLWSTGGQSSPQKGWQILLRGWDDEHEAFLWTLYGLSRSIL